MRDWSTCYTIHSLSFDYNIYLNISSMATLEKFNLIFKLYEYYFSITVIATQDLNYVYLFYELKTLI